MSETSYIIADPTFTFDGSQGSANSTDNNLGFVCINGTTLRVTQQKTPSSSTDLSYQGEICMDSNYIYVATSNNVWKRIGLSSF
jgi:hypothetical protein